MPPPRVLLIGGAPLVGKSTVARRLAARLDASCLSTDDLGSAIRSVTTPTSHPEFHHMTGLDYREYYVMRSVEQLLAEADRAHAALWPAAEGVIRAHATWSGPLVLEGWALRPAYVAGLDLEGLASVWLVAEETVFAARMRADVTFWRGASDEEAMIAHFVGRSVAHDERLRREAEGLGLPVVEVAEATSVEEVVKRCWKAVGGG